jgi:hypothetical protein
MIIFHLFCFCVIFTEFIQGQEFDSSIFSSRKLLSVEENVLEKNKKYFLDTYQCGLCVSSVKQLFTPYQYNISGIDTPQNSFDSVLNACLSMFPVATCTALDFPGTLP